VRFVPIVGWLPGYPRTWLRPDLIAAVTSWGVMVPVALAYAGLAGVPSQLGLATAFAAMSAYAIFGSSRHLKVTASSTMAVMSAAVVAGLAFGDPVAYVALTAALALVVGVILIVAGIVRLGFIADFLAKPVVTGFVFGLAIAMIIGQLPKIMGVPSPTGSLPEQLGQIILAIPTSNPYTVVVGVASLAIIIGLRLVSRRIPGPLIVLVLGILAVPAFDLGARGVSVVGEIATGLIMPSIPAVGLSQVPFLVLGAAGIVFLAVGESVGAARAYSTRHHYEIDQDPELIALGTANVAVGLFSGFTTDGSLSQTATAEAAGARSQLSSLVTAVLILLTLLFLAPLFSNLPNAVLGAIVIAAVLGLMDLPEMRRYWRWRRTDFAIAMAAMIGVLLTTVLYGMIFAVLLSVGFLLYRASRPYVAALGRLPGFRATFGDLARHPDAEPVDDLIIIRLDAPLYFFNANVARSQILDMLAARQPTPRGVLIDLAATADLDVTTMDMLAQLVTDLEGRSIEVMLAQVKGSVRDRLRRSGVMELIGENRVYLSIGSAVSDFQRRSADSDPSGAEDTADHAPTDHQSADVPPGGTTDS